MIRLIILMFHLVLPMIQLIFPMILKKMSFFDKDKPSDFNIFDPRVWDCLDSKMKDLLIEKGPNREVNTNTIFSKDSLDWKHLSETLKQNENSSDHMDNLRTWNETRIRLNKMKQLTKKFKK
uniref:Uncharacterized protein n=1 Tax=Lactuca sativa TaxID=4236 RepID=A0A9R1XAL4_LACSA|nr:hypothetical protein LSAT_V11C500250870 [Lactuca sativa]